MQTSTTIAPATRQTCVLIQLAARLAACLGLVALAACSAPQAPTAPSPTASAPAPTPHKNAVRSDFNGDGVSDLVLTDSSASYDGKYAVGYAAVIHGSADGLDLPSHQVITQNDLGLGKAGQGGGFGWPARSADLDGDGRSDFITQAGRKTVFLVWGGPGKLSGAAKLVGSAPLVGDFNGDGYQDLVTTDPAKPFMATVRLGPFTRAGVPHRTATFSLGEADATFDTATPSAVGDVTGDGRDDLLVTLSHIYADEAPVPRATILFRGTADGIPVAGTRLKDAQGKDMYGSELTTADVNKDSYADVIVGLVCESIGDLATPDGGSRLMVWYGGPDGGSRTLKPMTINDSTPGLPLATASTGCGFGSSPVAGDINGDGYADVAFIAPTADGRAPDIKEALLLLRGSAKGLTTAGAQVVGHGTGVPHPLAMLDTNGDKAAELIVGTGSTAPVNRQVHVLRGGPQGLDLTHPLIIRPADLGLDPQNGDHFGSGAGN